MEYSQSALVEGIKNKDFLAYEYMVNKYTKIIYCLIHKIICQSLYKEDIEECISDVFLDAWFKIDDFDQEKGNFRTWLLILAKYKALTYKRKKGIRTILSIDDYEIKDNYNLEKHFFLRQEQEQVIKIINAFNPIDKEIFFRRYFFGEKISDLARGFNLSRSAIDNRLLRGRKIIKEALNYE